MPNQDNKLVTLETLKNVIIITENEKKYNYNNNIYNCDARGRVIEKISLQGSSLSFPIPAEASEYLEYYTYATIMFDYTLSFKTYKEN